MKSMNTNIKNFLKLILFILAYTLALNCSSGGKKADDVIQTVTLNCNVGEEMINSICVPLCEAGKVRQADGTCSIIVCKAGEERNLNGVCVPLCEAGKVRQADGTCSIIVCKDGEEKNAKGVCVPVCEAGKVRQADGTCLIVCKDGEEKNSNGVCVPLCEVGKARQANGICSIIVDADGNGLIEIYTLEDLDNVRYNLAGTSKKTSSNDIGSSGGCPIYEGCRGYELKANLDFNNTKWASSYIGADKVYGGWNPIGDCGSDNTCGNYDDDLPFKAEFDGRGYEIRNLYINKPTQNYIGLFGYASGTSVLIKSLGVVNAQVIGSHYTGGLVGYQKDGSITNSYASGSVSGSSGTGGLVGNVYRGNITNSYASGAVSGRGDNTGGLVGSQWSGSITNSYASGAVSGRGDNTGGLVGSQWSGSISNSYASGAVSGGDNTGGLVGNQDGGSIANSYASGLVSGSSGTGGLVGYQINGDNYAYTSITNSYASGAVYGTNSTGGLVGWQVSVSGTSVTNSYASGSVSGIGYTGGLVGQQYGGNITNSYFVADKGINGVGINYCINCIKLNIEDILTLNTIPLKSYFTNVNWDTNSRAGNGHPAIIGTDGIRLSSQGWTTNFDTVILFKQDANSDYSKLLFGNKGNSFNLPSNSREAGIILDGVTLIGWSTNTPTNTLIDNNNLFNPNTIYLIPNSNSNSLTFYPIFNIAEIPQIAGDDGLIWISNASALYNIRYSPNGTYYQNGPNGFKNTKGCPVSGCIGYKLLNNIDFNTDSTAINWASNTSIGIGNGGWEPIGSKVFPFTATFDGKGFEIRNLYINKNNQDYIGLFGCISGTTTIIKSIGVYNAYVKGYQYTGGLVGQQNDGLITNSYAIGIVNGYNYTGGLVGNQVRSNITNSYASGSVSGVNQTGGLVGNQVRSYITNSYASGNVSGSDSTGGLVGYQDFGTSVTNSCASGSVSGSHNVGGLVGNQYGGITNSCASGNVSGTYSTGGLVGKQYGGITNSYASGSVSGVNQTGGLVGNQEEGRSIANSYASGSVSGSYYTGGLVGNQVRSYITNSYASGNVSGTYSTGGLVGSQGNSNEINSNGSITNSYASGSVSGNGNVGGLVGSVYRGDITNSYASGSVSGNGNVGGLLGYHNDIGLNSYTYWNSMSTQTDNSVTRTDAQKLSIGNRTWSTSSIVAFALSTSQLQNNMNATNATILSTNAFYTVSGSYPKLCYAWVGTCSVAYRLPGQD